MKKDIAWNTFGNIFYGFCTWVITIIVVRLGSFEDAGYLSLAMTTSSTYNAIALFAMRNYQITVCVEQSHKLHSGICVPGCGGSVQRVGVSGSLHYSLHAGQTLGSLLRCLPRDRPDA